MSLSTPPPCRSPLQNHGMCGPLCSSAARARYGRPAMAAPRAQMISLPRTTAGSNTWFSRYPCSSRRARSARPPRALRRGCAPAASRRRCRPARAPWRGRRRCASMFSMRAKFGPQIQMQSIDGSATISAIDAEGPRPRRRGARGRARRPLRPRRDSGYRCPRTSASRTACHARM